MDEDVRILVRIVLAMILAGAIGWEREAAGKSAGVRTHMFVGMGAAMFVSLGEFMIVKFRPYSDALQFDPIRLIEAVIAAVGFLGAGTIFVAGDKRRVRGLTTAAGIWVTAAIGITIALERYVLAVGVTILTLVVLHLILPLVRSIEPKDADESDSAG